MNINPGDIVIATAGRENGGHFVVVDVEDNFAFICDGKSRKADKPKKKKIKHIGLVIGHSDMIAQKLEQDSSVTNKEIKKELSLYREHNL